MNRLRLQPHRRHPHQLPRPALPQRHPRQPQPRLPPQQRPHQPPRPALPQQHPRQPQPRHPLQQRPRRLPRPALPQRHPRRPQPRHPLQQHPHQLPRPALPQHQPRQLQPQPLLLLRQLRQQHRRHVQFHLQQDRFSVLILVPLDYKVTRERDGQHKYWLLDDISVTYVSTGTNVLANGGFETGNLSNWTQFCATNTNCQGSNDRYGQITGSSCRTGSFCYVDKCENYDYLVQSFPTVSGGQYIINFYLKLNNNGGTDRYVYVLLNT
ncbi:unnamed protein product [Adineta ricciae]|uniref:Uncharacterized protein n=1 Tax=Adineta ricciae TaxID=249248 RepID=A0A814TCH6_ADIRI|nr:unnamed protein product [Adineta ricciae]